MLFKEVIKDENISSQIVELSEENYEKSFHRAIKPGATNFNYFNFRNKL
jgi:hypothetical protein